MAIALCYLIRPGLRLALSAFTVYFILSLFDAVSLYVLHNELIHCLSFPFLYYFKILFDRNFSPYVTLISSTLFLIILGGFVNGRPPCGDTVEQRLQSNTK